jgi:excisionase family DNA binding protein
MPRRSEVIARNRAVHGLADQIAAIDHAIPPKEMAKLLSVSRGQIYKLAKSTIPSFHLGTTVRFDPHSVAKWLRDEA